MMLRCRSRLGNSSLALCSKEPIILSSNHYLIELPILDVHLQTNNTVELVKQLLPFENTIGYYEFELLSRLYEGVSLVAVLKDYRFQQVKHQNCQVYGFLKIRPSHIQASILPVQCIFSLCLRSRKRPIFVYSPVPRPEQFT